MKADQRIRVVVAANFIAVAARMSLVTFLGIYFVHVAGISLATVGSAFLVESLLRGTLAPLFGALSDKVGRRTLLLASALLTALVLPSFLLVSGPATLFLWSTALGITGSVNMPVATALLLDLAPPERRQAALAVNYTGMSVAYTLGVMPAGFVAQQGYGLLAAVASLGYVAVAALYIFMLRGPLPLERSQAAANVLASTASVLGNPVFLAFAALAWVFPFAMGQVVTVSPLFAAELGLHEGTIGLVLGGNSILVALLAVPVATRVEPGGPFRPLGLAALMVCLAFCCYAWIRDTTMAYLAGTIVFSFGEIVFSSSVPAAVARLAPAGQRGAYQGGWTLVSSIAMGSALVLSGLLRDAAGWAAVWAVYAGLVLAAGAGLFLSRQFFVAQKA
ncbi:MAG TPA: MFS transporter [Burkholderiales bacterium]